MPLLRKIPNQINKPEVTSSTCLKRKFQGEQPVCVSGPVRHHCDTRGHRCCHCDTPGGVLHIEQNIITQCCDLVFNMFKLLFSSVHDMVELFKKGAVNPY